jgi:hypothetical protein
MATEGFDGEFDAFKLPGGVVELGIMGNNQKLSIQALPQIEETTIVPLSLKASINGEFKFQFENLSNFLSENQIAYLKDNQQGTIHELTEGNDVVVNLSSDEQSEGRFELIFSTNSTTGIHQKTESLVKVFPNPTESGKVLVSMKNMKSGKVKASLTDILGKKVLTENWDTTSGSISKEIALDVPAGSYILHLEEQDKKHTITI